MSVFIPVYADVSEVTTITLEGEEWNFEPTWNGTAKSWSIRLSNADETVIIEDITLVTNGDLIRPYGIANLGFLTMLDNSNKGENPDFDGLGKRFQLIYLTIAEMNEIL